MKNGKVIAQTPGARVRKRGRHHRHHAAERARGRVRDDRWCRRASPVFVTTTVTDKGEEPVTVTSAAASDSTTSAVELRRSGDKAEIRALTGDETKHLSDPKFSPKKTTPREPRWSAHAARGRDGAAARRRRRQSSKSPRRATSFPQRRRVGPLRRSPRRRAARAGRSSRRRRPRRRRRARDHARADAATGPRALRCAARRSPSHARSVAGPRPRPPRR